MKDPPAQSKSDDSDANLSVSHSALSISLGGNLYLNAKFKPSTASASIG